MQTVRDRLRAAAPSGLAMLGIGGCALCCALPLLLATGVLTGSVAAFLSDWLPGAASALVAAAVLAWWWTSRRDPCTSCGRDQTRSDTGSALGAGCSCSARTQA